MESAKSLEQVIDREINIGSMGLSGHIFLPQNARSVVFFIHGNESKRLSKRNKLIADALHGNAIGSLHFDLLTSDESEDRTNTFDIELLADRIDEAKVLLSEFSELQGLSFGYFGVGTGAAAALVAAAKSPDNIKAIISRGGRPDLACAALSVVSVPTLLIVGGADEFVVELNKKAFEQLKCKKSLEIIPGTTHLFSERGALKRMAMLTNQWFLEYL